MMAAQTYQTGYGAYQDRYDMLEADIDRRFGIFNTVTANKFLDLQTAIGKSRNVEEQCTNDINKVQKTLSFIMWYINLPWYKKAYYNIININLEKKFNKQKNV